MLFDFFDSLSILLPLAFGIFLLYLNFSVKHIIDETKQREQYDKYIEKHLYNPLKFLEEFNAKYQIASPDEKKALMLKHQEEQKKYRTKELKLCNEFIQKHPKNLYAVFSRATLYNIFKKYDEAIMDYDYLIKKDPKSFLYIELCAAVYAEKNEINTALDMINYFYAKKDKDDEYFGALGKIFDIAKQYDLAIKNYSEAIKINPYDVSYFTSRAKIYSLIGDEEKSKKDLDTAKELAEIPYLERLEMKNKHAKRRK